MKRKRHVSAKSSHKPSVNPSSKRTHINVHKHKSIHMYTYMHIHTRRKTDVTRQWGKQKYRQEYMATCSLQ